jgi:hypothetical protein
METISQLFPNSNDWLERFEMLGGATEIFEAACKACSLDDCIKENF